MREQFQLNYWEEEGGFIMPQLKSNYRVFDGHYEFIYIGPDVDVYSTETHNLICSFDPGPLDTQQDFEVAVAWFLFERGEF